MPNKADQAETTRQAEIKDIIEDASIILDTVTDNLFYFCQDYYDALAPGEEFKVKAVVEYDEMSVKLWGIYHLLSQVNDMLQATQGTTCPYKVKLWGLMHQLNEPALTMREESARG